MKKPINPAENLPALFSLSSDGYANSYKSEEGFHDAVRDYLEMLKEHGVKAVADSMAGWLAETSEMGCGDDITMLIAYFTQEEPDDPVITSQSTTEREDSIDE